MNNMNKGVNQDDLWNVRTLSAFNNMNFDMIINKTNLRGTEQYISLSRQKEDHVLGFEAVKRHKNKSVPTTYFIPTPKAEQIPIRIDQTIKQIFNSKVYNLVTDSTVMKIMPEKVYSFQELVNGSGLKDHTNPTHYTLYKIICLWCRLGKGCVRIVTPSAFGKDKYLEMVRLLINRVTVLTDPTIAKLNNRIQHDKLIVLSEMPGETTGNGFRRFTNALNIIADDRQILDNRARAARGTSESADISSTSVMYIHNPATYYSNGKGFKELMFKSTYNRYIPFILEGYTQSKFTPNLNPYSFVKKHHTYLKNWIKSALWYEENWHTYIDPYFVDLSKYKFNKSNERWQTNFVRLAKAVSLYAGEDKIMYDKLIDELYKSHIKQLDNEDEDKLDDTEELKLYER